MRFQLLVLLATSLVSYSCGEPVDAVRSHVRDFSLDVPSADIDTEIVTRDIPYHELQARAPVLPAGKDATKIHAWLRLDTRPSNYDDRGGANHDGLNQLMKDTGGRHVDVVIGNSKGYHQYGLMFKGPEWQKKPNGDGVPVFSYAGTYDDAPGEQFTYQGQVDGRKTHKSISDLGQWIPTYIPYRPCPAANLSIHLKLKT